MNTIKIGSFRMVLSFLMGLAISSLSFALDRGDTAPEFSAKNQDGKTVSLADFKGKPVLVYFYPKDETPGCTTQACSLRDRFSEFRKKGAIVLGVSKQSAESHQTFKSKHKLPFDLLVDEDGKIAEKLGVETMPVIGLHKRQSVLIGADGKVIKIYRSVNPDTHATDVLKDLP